MTARERAGQVLEVIRLSLIGDDLRDIAWDDGDVDLVETVIRAAVAEEREACLAVVETYGEENGHMDGLAEAIAMAIRMRGGG